MDLEKILSRVYGIKDLKQEINNEIRKNEANINIDKLEFFDFMHKVEKLDLMINSLIDEIKMEKEDQHKAQIDKEDILSAFNLHGVNNKKDNLHKKDIKDEDDIKCYVIGKNKEEKNEKENEKNKLKDESDDDVKVRPASSIEEAYKRIAKLESLMNERRFIERDEEISHMKDIHSKEEREEMLGKRKIIAQTFTPKARKQSDPEMDKTVAMSKDEFYNHINEETKILENNLDLDINNYKKSSNESSKKDEGFNLDAFRDKKIIKNDNTNYNQKSNMDHTEILNMDHTAILDISPEHHIDTHDEEEYDIYNEEKSNGIFDIVKDFLSK